MKVEPVASDSMGVRSLATYVKTADLGVFIDPGAALGPKRYGLPPAREETEALFFFKERIRQVALGCDVLLISHYHFDHFDPDEDFYKDKIVYAKDRHNNINKSQQGRGLVFQQNVADMCKQLIYCDDTSFSHGDTEIKFSPPFPHGPEGTRLGFVLMTTIDDGEHRFMHTSDVQGPISTRAAEYIIEEAPDTLLVDGPPTIFLGWMLSQEKVNRAIDNLLRIIDETDAEIILDHHLVRDLRYKSLLSSVYETGKVKTAAEYLGVENNMLEAHRKELWADKDGS